MVGHHTLDVVIGVRVPVSQSFRMNKIGTADWLSLFFCVPMVCQLSKNESYCVPFLMKSMSSNFSEAACCIEGMTCE